MQNAHLLGSFSDFFFFFGMPKSNTGSGAKVNHIPLRENLLKSDCQVLGESCKYVVNSELNLRLF